MGSRIEATVSYPIRSVPLRSALYRRRALSESRAVAAVVVSMPTRITLKQNAPKLVQAKMRSKAALSPTFLHASDASSPPPPQRHESHTPTTTAVAVNKRRQLPTFRSSILRELSDKSGVVDIEKERMATDDIRASPRLVGYLFSMIAGAVMLVSVAQLSIICFL